MPSKLVNARHKSGVLVLASLFENKPLLARKLFEWPGFPPEVATAILDVLGDKLEKADNAMIAADHAHLAELDDDAPFRRQRDEAELKTRETLGDLRETVGFCYGDTAKRDLGLDARPPVDATMLHSLGKMVLDRMATWTPPATSRIEGYTFDKAGWTAKLTAQLEPLGAALSAVAREKRESETTQQAKNRAIEEYDRTFSLTATLLSTLLEAAGEKTLARRVRPSTRHPGQTIEAAAEATTITPENPPADG
ncbi:MAG: hypothetical protein ACOX6T_05890 [Myxococcales bacterium]